MRFDLPESIEAMRAGRKTQTRRRSTYWLGKCVGSRITIAHRGQLVGWATVHDTYQQRLYRMTDNEAMAEGYADLDAFLKAWASLYPPRNWQKMLDTIVTVVEFGNIRWRKEAASSDLSAPAKDTAKDGGR